MNKTVEANETKNDFRPAALVLWTWSAAMAAIGVLALTTNHPTEAIAFFVGSMVFRKFGADAYVRGW